MRHYEIMILIHPDQSDRLQHMLKKYRNIIEENDGKIHRQEDLGKRQLAYQIKNLHKAHYILMNIECNKNTLTELNTLFRFNDSIIRNLIIQKTKAINVSSILKK